VPTSEATFLAGGGKLGAMMRERDWNNTPLGDAEHWPQSLKTAASILINLSIPGAILWGPERVLLYNDEYIPALAGRHPAALGKSTLLL